MNHLALFILALVGFLSSGCGNDLERAKGAARQKVAEIDAALMDRVPVIDLPLTETQPGTHPVAVNDGIIRVLPPNLEEIGDRATTLHYPTFRAIIIHAIAGEEFSSLPPAWGSDDLEKTRLICRASGRLIESATDREQLEQAMALLVARATIAPAGSFDRLHWIENHATEGLLSGELTAASGTQFLGRRINDLGTNFLIYFQSDKDVTEPPLLRFLASLVFEPDPSKTDP